MAKYNNIQRASFTVLLLLTIGLGLQSFLGFFPLEILAFPTSLYSSIIFLLVCFSLQLLFAKWQFARFLSSGTAAISAMAYITLMTLILGLTHQTNNPDYNDLAMKLGFRSLTRYYPFVLSYLYLLTTLSFAIAKKLKYGKLLNNISFLFNHVGLLLLLISLGVGSVDYNELRIGITEGNTVSQAKNKAGHTQTLPFRIKLIDFKMETYSPKLAIIDEGGVFLPKGKPEFWDVDTLSTSFSILDINFELIKYINQSIELNGSYYSMPDNSLPPAALIKKPDGKTSWTSCANTHQLTQINDSMRLVMLSPEAKYFASNIELFTPLNDTIKATIAVNSPLHYGSWSIYQSSYDDKAGKASKLSIFQLVYDPWKKASEIGLILLLIGAVTLFWRMPKSKK